MTEIIAEISANHGGRISNAIDLIAAAVDAGADAVKFQCFVPELLATKRANSPYVLKLAQGRPLIELYRQVHTPREWFPALIRFAQVRGIRWFSSVFDPIDVEFLEEWDCPRYKISAFEMLDGHLINAVVATGKPIVMSVRPMPGLTILEATDYAGEIIPMGLSDHSPGGDEMTGNYPMIERHICLPGVETPDSAFSSTPEQFKRYVAAIRTGEK